jgi:hypothetical protein
MEADRQLDLADLLSTAAAVGRADNLDPWARTVIAMADDHCRRHTPSQVLLNRLGARAWGGIGLAAALALTLAALSSAPGDLRAGTSRGATTGRGETSPGSSEPLASGSIRHTAHAPMPSPQEDRAVGSSNPSTATRPDDASESSNPSPSSNTRASASSQAGRGDGVGRAPGDGRTQDAAAPSAMPPGSTRDQNPSGTPSAGGGAASRPSSDGAPTAGSTTGGTPARAAKVPPWQSSSWPADARRAREAIDAGRIPDAYRDLVRDYFDRP